MGVFFSNPSINAVPNFTISDPIPQGEENGRRVLVVYFGFNTCFVLFLFNDLTTAVGTSSADNGYDPR
jgi:hypothetical protein